MRWCTKGWLEKCDAYINLLKTKECVNFFPPPCSDSSRIPRIPAAAKKHYYVFPPTRWQRYSTDFLKRTFWSVLIERIIAWEYLHCSAYVCFHGTVWVNAQLAQSSCALCSRHTTPQLLLPDNVVAWYRIFNQQNLTKLKWNDFQGQSQFFVIDSLSLDAAVAEVWACM